MSIRQEACDYYVYIKGTMVSTLWTHPSTLHVSVVQSFGLPNAQNKIITNDYVIHMTYGTRDDSLVYVWAQPRPTTPPPTAAERVSGACAVS